MSNAINYHWGENELLIDLGNRVEPRIKVFFWGELLITTSIATVFLLQSFPISQNWFNTIAGICAGAIYLFASYRFISRMFTTEKLLLKPNYLQIITRSPFSYKVNEYDWEYIGPLHYVGEQRKTDHPLRSGVYDLFGFDGHEKLMQNLHKQGNLFFNYGGFSVRFGKGVYSWNAEEVVNMMRLYKGDKIVLGPEWDAIMQSQEIFFSN